METVIACGIIRQAAELIRSGEDVDAALQRTTKGASKAVKEGVIARLQAAIPSLRRAPTPDEIRQAILSAAARLDH